MRGIPINCSVQSSLFLGLYKPTVGIKMEVTRHTSEAVDAEYGYEAKYKVMHQGEKVAVIAAGSFYQKGENVGHDYRTH